jgi:hypothetical protein
MAKELPYFKFNISEWMLGRIQKQPESVQGMFVNLCCKYWHKLGEYSYEDACDDFGKKRVDALVSSKILKISENFLKISFLDEQLEERETVSKKQSEKGLKSAEIRAKKKQESTTVEHRLNPVQPNSTEKKREEEKREEEKREEEKREEDALSVLGIDKSVEKLLKDDYWLHSIHHAAKGKDLGGAARSAFVYLEAAPARFKTSTLNDLKRTTLSWLEKMKPAELNGTDHKKRLDAL